MSRATSASEAQGGNIPANGVPSAAIPQQPLLRHTTAPRREPVLEMEGAMARAAHPRVQAAQLLTTSTPSQAD